LSGSETVSGKALAAGSARHSPGLSQRREKIFV